MSPKALDLTASAVRVQNIDPKTLTLNPDKFQLFPALSDDDFSNLSADIQANGIKVPVEVDTEGNVLDGHNRVAVAQSLKLDKVPALVRSFKSDDERAAHIMRLNLQRRHLNQADKRRLLKEYVKLSPEKSNRQIASETGVATDKTVGEVRKELESKGEVKKSTTRVGKDGKKRAATTTRKSKENPERVAKELIGNRSRSLRTALSEQAKMIELGLTPEDFVGVLVKTQPDQVRAALAEVMPFLEKVSGLLDGTVQAEPF